MSKRSRLAALLLTLLVTLALGLALWPGLALGAPKAETLWLDLYEYAGEDSSPNEAGPIFTSKALKHGKTYVVTVTGTFSVWCATCWTSPCGARESAPMYASTGTANGPVGVDAEWHFAGPYPGQCPAGGTAPVPLPTIQFSVDGGGTWFVGEAIDLGTGPSSGHSYTYEVTGLNSPLGVKRGDTILSDNYGVLEITVAQKRGK